MTVFRAFLRAGAAPVLLLAAGCGRGATERAPTTAAAEPAALTAEQLERRSPSAAVVDAFAAVCAEPARRPVAREAARRGFEPVPTAVLREELAGAAAAFPPEAEAWRGPEETGGAVLLWDPGTATCELRALRVDPVVVEAEFAKLPQTLEEAGASVMRLQPPPPGRAGAPRMRQMLLVSPSGRAEPERARVLRLGDGGAKDAAVLSARSVAGAPPATAR
jgi:hypothetical protein